MLEPIDVDEQQMRLKTTIVGGTKFFCEYIKVIKDINGSFFFFNPNVYQRGSPVICRLHQFNRTNNAYIQYIHISSRQQRFTILLLIDYRQRNWFLF